MENEGARWERQRLLDIGLNQTPQLTREGILEIVSTAWMSIDHKRVAEKGYRQTGPTMPLTGPVHPEDVQCDMLKVLEALEASPDPNVVAMSWRDEAVAFVEEGWVSRKWTEWKDCHKLIEEQDGIGEALEEGLEAFGEEADDYVDVPDDIAVDEDGGDVASVVGLSAETGPGPPGGVDLGHEPGESDGDDGVCSVDGATVSGGPAIAPSEPSPLAAASEADVMNLAAAQQVVYHEAVRTGDNVMLRHVRKRMRTEDEKSKEKASKIGVILLERGLAMRDAERRAHQDRFAEDQLAAKDLEVLKVRRAEAEKATAEARLANLKQAIVNRQDAQARKERDVVERSFRLWLQTQYPALVARRAMAIVRDFTPNQKTAWLWNINKHISAKTFRRQVFVKNLWESDPTFTQPWAQATSPFSDRQCVVRCGVCFQQVVNDVHAQTYGAHNPVDTLLKLFQACGANRARDIFENGYSPLRMLAANDFVMEKAFLYGIICLSKWLSEDEFPQGVFGDWPPPVPDGLVAEWSASAAAPAPSMHDAQLPPHTHVGAPAASSGAVPQLQH